MNFHDDPLYAIVQSAVLSVALAALVVALSAAVAGFHNPLNNTALPMIVLIIVFFVGLWYLPQRQRASSN